MNHQEEVKQTERLVAVKLIKLVNGESLVAMVENHKTDESVLILYNPYRLIFGELTSLQKTAVMMEEWLPAQIAQEQMCEILHDDVLTMVDVSDEFSRSYTKTVLKRVNLDEIVRRSEEFFGKDPMKMSQAEAEEHETEDMVERIEDAIKKLRSRDN